MPVTNPNAMSSAFVEAVNGEDLEALLALYDPSVKYVTRSGRTLDGQAAVHEFLQRLLKLKGKMEIENDYCIVSDDIALVRARWSFTATGPDGAPMENHGRSTEVLRRGADGLWRYLIDHPFGAD